MSGRRPRFGYAVFPAAALALFITASPARSQAGKITGVVTDAQTGEPLSGVQVYLESIGRGALSAENGRYFLVNVPVGTYTVVAEFIGYATFRLEGVFLSIDQTRSIDFQMTREAIGLEELRVEVERVPLLDVTATGGERTVTPEEIAALPVNNIEEALSLQQGFLKVPDQTNLLAYTETRRNALTPIRMRGGRAGETLMLIDGIPVNNFLFGSPAVSITPEVISQLDLVRGGFPPQYGNALSGIVNIATKEGGSQLHGAVGYRSGEIGAALGNDHDDVANFDLFEGYVAGPVPGTEWGSDNPRLRFMFAGRQQNGADRVLEFDDDIYDPTDRPDTDTSPFLGPNYMDLWPGWRGLGFNRQRDVFGKLTYHFTPNAKLNFTAIDYEQDRKPFDWVYLLTYGDPLDAPVIDTQADSMVHYMNRFGELRPPLGYPLVVENAIKLNRRLFVLAWDHTLGRGAYRIAAGKFDQGRLTCNWFNGVCLEEQFADPNYFDNFVAPKAGTCESHPTCGVDYFYGGEELESWVARADAQWQATDHHNLAAGVYYETHDVVMDEVRNIGGNEVVLLPQKYSAEPWSAAFYIQDKIEYDFVTVNFGIRFDWGKAGGLFFPNVLDPTNGTTATGSNDPTDPGYSPIIRRDGPCIAPEKWQNVTVRYFNGQETVTEVMSADPSWTRDTCLADDETIRRAALIASSDDFLEAGTRSAVSPRIGVSFPVTANSSFFFNFGRFTQNPLLNNVYVNTGIGVDTTITFIGDSGAVLTRTSSLEGTPTGVYIVHPKAPWLINATGVVGNPNLTTEKTTLYEMGYLAELWDDYAISVILYSKDQTGLQGIRTGGTSQGVQVLDAGSTYGSSRPVYQVMVNQDFQSVRGFELSLRRRIVDYWGFDINYSFARAKTNAAGPEKEFETQILQGDPDLRIEVNSEIDRPQRLSGAVFFRMGNEAPTGWGWAKNSSFTVVGRYQSGFPYTPTTDIYGGGINQLTRNSERGPPTWSVDIRAAKAFWWGNVLYDFFLQVNNLFDTKNCQEVFPTTGSCTDGMIDPDKSREGGSWLTSTSLDRPHYLGPRRTILGGLRISF